MRPDDQFLRRDDSILNLTATHGLVVAATVSLIIFGKKQAGHILRRMADGGLLTLFPRALPGSITYATLSEAACRRIGTNLRCAQPPSGHRLSNLIALLSFCTLGDQRRILMRPAEAVEMFGPSRANIPFVVMAPAELGRYAVLRTQFAAPTATQTIKMLARHIAAFEADSKLTAALGPEGSIGFCVLAPTVQAARAIDIAVQRSGFAEHQLIHVEYAPGAEQLAPFLRARKLS